MCRNPGSFAYAIFAIAAIISAHSVDAIVIRADYDHFNSTSYNRYISLSNQARFETVGSIQLYDAYQSPTAPHVFRQDCTGILISATIILTAAHCFGDGAGNVKSFQQSVSRSAMPILTGKQVVFAAGPNLAKDDRYLATNVRYAVKVDRLSIHPSFDLSNEGVTFGPDLALLRIYGSPWIGMLPTRFLALNKSRYETSIPPAFAVTIGYGMEGNGLVGDNKLNEAVERRAGLTEVVLDLNPFRVNTLASTFHAPQDFPVFYPSNFLQAAPASGDSGGPLIMEIGDVDGDGVSDATIIGIFHGGAYDSGFYGQVNYWTRVSSFWEWITNEAGILGSAPIATVSGSVDSPLLPQAFVVRTPFTFDKLFQYYIGPGLTVFLDPAPAEDAEIIVTKGPNITSLLLPAQNALAPTVWLFDTVANAYVDSGLSLFPGVMLTLPVPGSRVLLKGFDTTVSAQTIGFVFEDSGNVSLTWRSTTSATPVTVPDTVGLAQAAASTAITTAGLAIGTVATQSSLTMPAGNVISQNPTAGTSVPAGSAVNLIVSLGAVPVAVPNVVGQAPAAAMTAITNVGLVVGTVTTQSSPIVPAGSVISQNPTAETSVTAGSSVNLVVSSGPPPVVVPDVIGQSQGAATTTITTVGLVVGAVTTQSSPIVPTGRVISQNPTAGISVTGESLVNLVVSSGPVTSVCAAGHPVPNTVQSTPIIDFVDHGDGTVTHAKTGLMWKRCAEGQVWNESSCTGSASILAWSGALTAANTANESNGGLGFANHTDWRLPNVKELQSVVEMCGGTPAINQAMFPATEPSLYWASTVRTSLATFAWTVSFDNGSIAGQPHGNRHRARLVRDGHSPAPFDILPPLHKVKYYGNGSTGGSVPVDTGTYVPGANVLVAGNTGALANVCGTFAGWNTLPDGSGATYLPGSILNMGLTNVSLWAQWTAPDDNFPPAGAIPPGWTVPPGSSAGWVVATDSKCAGPYSLKSGDVADGQTAAIEVSVPFSAGNITFRVRTSSQLSGDPVKFYVDGVIKDQWSGVPSTPGNPAWESVSLPIAAGAHTYRWAYVKNASVTQGEDAAWIDSVVLPPTVILKPTVTTNAATSITNGSATLNGTVSSNGGDTTIAFEYGLTNTYGNTVAAAQSPLPASVSAVAVSAVISRLACGAQYFFRAVGTNSGGTTNGSGTSFLTTSDCPEDNFPPSGLLPSGWTTSPAANAGFTVASDFTHGGAFSLKSATITHSQTAAIQVSGTYPAGAVSFWVRGSSQYCCDNLRFSVDGVVKFTSGVANQETWKFVSIPVSAGAHTFKWAYVKDATNTTGSDAVWIDSVVLPTEFANTSTIISAHTPNPSIVGTSIAVTANVAASPPGAGTPTGTITVTDGTANCTITLPATSCNLIPIGPGSKTLTATYGGDAAFNGSTSAGVGHTVNKAGTSTVISAHTPNPSNVGATVVVTASVTEVPPIADTPTGVITVSDGSAICAITLPATSCNLVLASAGVKTLTATYTGDADFAGSTSPGISHTVNGQATSTAISAHTPNPSNVGVPIAVTAIVTPSGTGTPTGTITVSDGTAACPITLPATSCNLTPISAGVKTLRATYGGDAAFNGSVSPGVGHTVVGAASTATLQTVVSRKVHGGAGTFDLPLNTLATDPTTEPRSGGIGGNHSIVFVFDKAVTGGTASVTAGTGTTGTPSFSGNEMIVPLTGVANQQYVTVSVSNVAATDGGTGGSGSVRVGFLHGDVNQNRVVTVSDLAQVNAQIAQVVGQGNYLKDVNASGTLTVADKGIANTQITKALPAP